MRTSGRSLFLSSTALKWLIVSLFVLIAAAAFFTPPSMVNAPGQLALMAKASPSASRGMLVSIEHQGRVAGLMEKINHPRPSSSGPRDGKTPGYAVGATGIRG
jgi:hypothetical protein